MGRENLQPVAGGQQVQLVDPSEHRYEIYSPAAGGRYLVTWDGQHRHALFSGGSCRSRMPTTPTRRSSSWWWIWSTATSTPSPRRPSEQPATFQRPRAVRTVIFVEQPAPGGAVRPDRTAAATAPADTQLATGGRLTGRQAGDCGRPVGLDVYDYASGQRVGQPGRRRPAMPAATTHSGKADGKLVANCLQAGDRTKVGQVRLLGRRRTRRRPTGPAIWRPDRPPGDRLPAGGGGHPLLERRPRIPTPDSFPSPHPPDGHSPGRHRPHRLDPSASSTTEQPIDDHQLHPRRLHRGEVQRLRQRPVHGGLQLEPVHRSGHRAGPRGHAPPKCSTALHALGRAAVLRGVGQTRDDTEMQPPPTCARLTDVTVLRQGGLKRPDRTAGMSEATVLDGDPAGIDLAALYTAHRLSLARLALLLVDEMATAEDVVHDAFIALQLHPPTSFAIPPRPWPTSAPAWWSGSRSLLRKRQTVRKHLSLARDEPRGCGRRRADRGRPTSGSSGRGPTTTATTAGGAGAAVLVQFE